MLKLTSLAIGLLSLIAISPSVEASPLFKNHNNYPAPNIQKTVTIGGSQPQIFVTVGSQNRPGYRPEYRPQAFPNFRPKYRWESESDYRRAAARHRQIEIAREREARARWEAKYRRPGYPSPYRTYQR